MTQSRTTATAPLFETKKLVNLSLLAALAYLSVFLIRVPVVAFLSYEPKDLFITLAGFLYGPLATVLISVVVSFVEMVTISSTGLIGFVMNVISSVAFAGTAALVYKKFHNMTGAVIGLALGMSAMTGVMLLWNYLITPIYMGYPRAAVKAMLVPVFLPFNLLKSGLNTALTLLCYKPFITLLRLLNLRTQDESEKNRRGQNVFLILLAVFLLLTCIYFVLVLQGKL